MPSKNQRKRKRKPATTGRVPIEDVLRLAKSHRHADRRAVARKTEGRRKVTREDF